MLEIHEQFMKAALNEAMRAFDTDEVPVGAVITFEGRLIARAHNQVELLHDATAHAEMIALTQASEFLGRWRLTGCTLYVTLEPCSMCAGALVSTRVDRLVFAAHDSKAGACGSLFNIIADERLNHRIQIMSGIMASDSEALLKEFFQTKRKEKRVQ